MPVHHTDPNLYTVLSSIAGNTAYFPVPHLKDVFSSIPLDTFSQDLLPLLGQTLTLSMTNLDCPCLFGQALLQT